MSQSRNFRCSFAARLGVAFAAIFTWFVAPGAFAQYSSSATYHDEMASLTTQDQGEYPNQGGYPRQGYNLHQGSSFLSHLAVEAGGGFNRPVGNTRSFETWGGNLTLGAGWNFNHWFSTLAEWQFLDNKVPGAYLANVGVPGGHVHTWGLTLQPTVNFQSKGSLGGYAFGGGGFYRRVTTFTVPELEEECYYFCYEEYVNVPVAHYSSNQGGFNIGGGVTWKAFGADSSGRLFAEARYLWVNSPSSNVFGTPDGQERFVPITVGIRW